MMPSGFLYWLLALLVLVGSGIQVVFSTHKARQLHIALQIAQADQDGQLANHSRLLLERSALAAFQNVERLAEDELGMRFPMEVERINR